jgi:hypothetical protein
MEHARILERLDDYQNEIQNLQQQRNQLLQQATARTRAEQAQDALRQAEARRDRLVRQIQQLQVNPRIAQEDIVLPEANLLEEDAEAIDPTSPLSAELQRHPWPLGYKPRIPAFDGKSNPKKFIASYETTVYSAGGDSSTLAKSLIMAVGRATRNIRGISVGGETTRDLLNCIQQDNEPLSKYLERFIQLKAQVPNVPEATVIAATIEGLAIGQCASHLSREPPATVKELFEVMREYARSEDDLRRRKAARSSLRKRCVCVAGHCICFILATTVLHTQLSNLACNTN